MIERPAYEEDATSGIQNSSKVESKKRNPVLVCVDVDVDVDVCLLLSLNMPWLAWCVRVIASSSSILSILANPCYVTCVHSGIIFSSCTYTSTTEWQMQ